MMISIRKTVFHQPTLIKICSIVILLGIAATSSSQNYFEASGQTKVFTLAAGAKSGPDAVRNTPAPRLAGAHQAAIALSRNSIIFTQPFQSGGLADVAVYNVAGRLVFRQTGIAGRLFLDTRRFAPGIYQARLTSAGHDITRRFVTAR